MPYDEALAGRIRDLLAGDPAVEEKKMFGGLAFLVSGNMAVAASGGGGALVRVDPERAPTLCAGGKAAPMVMRGRPMDGWLVVAPEQLRTGPQLARWVRIGTDYARTLAPKAAAGPPAKRAPRRRSPAPVRPKGG